MRIILSTAKTISKSELKSNKKVEFSKFTNAILAKIPDVRLSNDFYRAFFMYDGLCYRSMERENFTKDDLKYIENHLVILSALYGAVKPFDLINPYRLDFLMKTDMGNLYKFWKDEIAKQVIEKQDFIINLASDEFSKLVKKYSKNVKIIDCEFYEMENGKLKKHSTISKKGRGKMLKFLATKKITEIEKIREFNLDNYKYNSDLSTENKFVFVREIL